MEKIINFAHTPLWLRQSSGYNMYTTGRTVMVAGGCQNKFDNQE